MGLGIYLELIKKLGHLTRWATEFMHNRPSVSENSFAVAQVGQMLAIIEEKNGVNVNWDKLSKKLLNNNVLEALTGHLTHRIKDKSPEMRRMLSYIEKQIAYEDLLSKIEEPYKSIYENLLFDRKDATLEGRILGYANKIVTLMECIDEIRLGNKNPFEETYREILSTLKESRLESVHYFVDVILPQLEGKGVGLGNYLIAMKKLNNMGRWATEYMHERTTVSEHSFSVAQIGQMLAIIEEQEGNQQVDWGKLFKYLINHDVMESLTGDIISTVKYKKQEMKKLVDLIEKEIGEEQLLHYIPDLYKEDYRSLLFVEKDHTLEGRILAAADNIDALLECIAEIKLANYEPFLNKYHVVYDKISTINLSSVKIFIEQILPEITANIPKLCKKKERT